MSNKNKTKKSSKSLLTLIQEILGAIGGVVGSVMAIYGFIKAFRDDSGGFIWTMFLGVAIWAIVLWQMFQRRKIHTYIFLALTTLGGVAGWVEWQNQAQTKEDRLIVLIAEFDGPEEVYGLRNEIIENLNRDFGGSVDVKIETVDEVIAPESNSGSSRAKQLGAEHQADIVVWGWYRPTENPNITIHIENLSPQLISILEPSSTFQPVIKLTDLENFEFQQTLGNETTALLSFISGIIKYQEKDSPAAVHFFNKALEVLEGSNSPFINDRMQIHFRRGLAYSDQGLYAEAVDDFSKVIQLAPTTVSAYINRGSSYGKLEKYDEAIADFTDAIRMDPRDSTAYFGRGAIYFYQKRYDLSILEYDKAIELNPQEPDAYDNRGIAYRMLDQFDHALADFSTAIQIDPVSSSAYMNRGNTYRGMGKYELAISDYTKAIEIDPQYYIGYNNRGNAYADSKQYEKAILDYTKAIELSPQFAEAYNNRGTVYAELEKYGLAILDFSNAIQINPEFAEAYANRGVIYQKVSKSAEAEADFRKYEKLTIQKP